jgi:GT2 family glycosyltransferase
MPTLSVSIVNWNTRDLLAACLDSLLAETEDLQPQIVVTDNGSSDGSAEMVRTRFPQVTLIANPVNLGYSAAMNAALRAASAEYRLLLDGDAAPLPGSVHALCAFLDAHPRAGAVAPQLHYPDGRIQPSCRAFPTPWTVLLDILNLSQRLINTRAVREYLMADWGHDTERRVDQPMSAALLVRETALEQADLMDEGSGTFFNDVGLCYRLQQAGWEVWFTPTAQMTHHLGTAMIQIDPARRLQRWYAGWVHYYRRHFRQHINPLAFWGWRALVGLAFGLQWLRIAAKPGARVRRLLVRGRST